MGVGVDDWFDDMIDCKLGVGVDDRFDNDMIDCKLGVGGWGWLIWYDRLYTIIYNIIISIIITKYYHV